MKSKFTSIGRIVLILCCFALVNIAKGQSPTYLLKVTNESQPSPTTYEFDVFLLSTGATPLELQTIQFGLGWDTSILMGGTQSYSIVTTVNGNAGLPAPSELLAGQVPTALPNGGALQVFGGVSYRFFNCAAKAPPGAGAGTIISSTDGGCGTPGSFNGHPGTRVARFRLTNSVPFRANSTCKHVWSSATGSGRTNTIIQAYVPPSTPATGVAANITSFASQPNFNQTGSCLIQPQGLILNPTATCTQPTANAGGPYTSCSGTVQLNGGIGGDATVGTWSSPTNGTFNPSNTTLNAVYTPSAADLVNGSVILSLTTNNPNGAPCTTAVSTATVTFISTDDGNLCTQDICNSLTGGVSHPPIAGISDENLCTDDICNSSTGITTHPPIAGISDGNLCTDDVCNTSNGVITHPPIAGISDGDLCTDDICNSGTGVVTHPPIAGISDGNLCTDDVCNSGTGVITHPVSAGVSDGNLCTDDICNSGTGITTHPPIAGISDGNLCTDDICNSGTGVITHPPIAGISDGNLCTDDICNSGTGITTHPPIAGISDGNLCTDDICNSGTGITTHPPIAGISDGNLCTDDICNSGTGITTHPPIAGISDGNLCTNDVCNSATGITTHPPIAGISDGNLCTDDICNSGTGITTHPPIAGISDGNLCTDDICNSGTGVITHPTAASVSDGNLCTDDICNSGTGVTTHPPVAAINDGNLCTNDVCVTSTGVITHPPIAGISDGNLCTDDICNSGTGVVTHPPIAGISDGNLCTDDICNSGTGVITHPQIAGTSDGNLCTDDICSSTTGVVTHPPVAGINDGNACTNDVCVTSTGVITHPPIAGISDGNACTDDVCNSGTGVITHPAIAGISDGNLCTDDVCNTGTGVITHPPIASINDGNACTNDVCVTSTGVVTHPPIAGINDGNACTNDVCNTGTGVITHPPLAGINDGNACTDDVCNTGTGVITHPPIAGISDGNACTEDICNTSTGVITHPPIPGCGQCTSPPTANAGGPYNSSCGNIQLAGSVGGSATGGTWSSPSGGTFIPNATTLNAIYHPSAADLTNGSVLLTLTSNNPSGAPCVAGVGTITLSFTSTSDGNECTSDVCNTTTGLASHTPVNIDDGNQCTADACNTATGAISHDPKIVAHVNTTPAGCNTNDGTASATPVGAGFTYLWSPGGQTTNPATGLAGGTYVVTVTDASGCTGTASGLVGSSGSSVVPGPISGPAGACRGQSGVVYCIEPIPGTTSYNWTLPPGASISGPSHGPCITVRFNSHFNGGQICVNATSNCGTTANSCLNVPRITHDPNTPGQISGPSPLCPGTCGTYSVAPVADATSYIWSTTGGLVITSGQGTNTVVICAPSGFVNGKIKVKANNCKGSSGTRTKTVNGIPSTPIWKYNPPRFACAGQCYDFNIDNVQDALSWTCEAPPGCVVTSPGGTPGSGNPFTSFTKSLFNICFPQGFVSGTVTIYSTNSCGNSDVLTYVVNSVPPAPLFSNHSDDNHVTGVCGNSTHEYEILLIPGASCYTWTAPQGAIINDRAGHTGNPLTVTGNINDVDITFPNGFISGDVTVTSCNSCGQGGTSTLFVTSASPAQPGAISGPSPVCKHSTRAYSISSVTGATSYTWSVTGGATINSGQGTTNVTVRFNSASSTTAILSVKAKNRCGSSLTTTLTIDVNLGCKITDVTEAIETNLNSEMVSDLSAYPNPTSGKAKVTFTSDQDAKYNFRIIDILGKVMISESIYGVEGYNEKEINLDNVSKGLYIISVETEGGKAQRIRLVVE